MKIRITRTAAAEIDEIFSYIARHNPRAAEAVVRQIDRTIGRIGKYPAMGHLKYRANVRMLPVGRFRQYVVFYTIEDDDIERDALRLGRPSSRS